MKITKFVHACLLVEMPEPVNRTVLFDPGMMSEAALHVDQLEFLDDIVITHGHPDHYSPKLLEVLTAKFPNVRITAPAEVVAKLAEQNITAQTEPAEGMELFDSPHEPVEPLFPQPENIGVHYLDTLTVPGDSHSFTSSKAILALPTAAPWGSSIRALNLALELKPQYVIPIHDWHWSEDAKNHMYPVMSKILAEQGITLLNLATGKPEVINT